MRRALRVLGACLPLSAVLVARLGAQSPVGTEKQVNAVRGVYSTGPSVALAADGTGSVIFNGNLPQKNWMRLLDPNGAPQGPESRLAVPPIEDAAAYQSQVSTRLGRGTACWTDAHRVYCRDLDTRTGFTSAPYRVDSVADGQYDPFVSILSSGGRAVSWVHLQDEVLQARVRFVGEDRLPVSPVFELATFPSYYEMRTAVAAIDSERVVVVWNQLDFDGSDDGIVGRIVSVDGAMSAPFLVNTFTPGPQRSPVVASDLEGNFVVAWSSDGQDSLYHGIYAQRFDRNGLKLGPEFQVSGATYPSDQGQPEIAMDSLGNFVIAYYSSFESEDEGEDIFLRAYRADGTPYGSPVRANDVVDSRQEEGAVALSDSGVIQVVYRSLREVPEDPWPYTSYDVLTRRFALPCIEDGQTLCLGGGRFQVRAFWKDYAARLGPGRSVPLGDSSGGFWFFAPDNFELLVKVLDGCGSNGRFWIYSAGLTDVEVDLLVTDTWTGQALVYSNPLGQPFSPVQTIDRLDGCGAEVPLDSVHARATAAEAPSGSGVGAVASAGCTPDATTLCLEGGRFRAHADWRSFSGAQGGASALPFGDDSGLFWIFAEDNVELSVKVLDGCEVNGHYWVYASGLTNLAIDLQVEDTVSGLVWSERTALAEPFPSRLDSSAFAVCN